MQPTSNRAPHPAEIRAVALGVLTASAALAALLAFGGGAAWAEPISAEYDGRYSGTVEAVEPLSEGACRDGGNVAVRIEGGSLQASDVASERTMRAIVTEDGFFTGETSIGSGDSQRIEGLIDGGTLVGGVFGGRCAWLVKLNKSGERQQQQQKMSQADR